jgi:hypothetical protein
MTERSRLLLGSYLDLVDEHGLHDHLVGPTEAGHGTLGRAHTLLASGQRYVDAPLAGVSALQDIADRRVTDVENCLGGLGHKVDERHVLTGLFPIGEVNAWTTPADDGDLILLNRGTFGLIHLTLKINLMSAVVFDQPALTDRDTTVELLAEVFAAYFRVNDPWRARQLPRLDPQRETMLGLLVNAAERFVVAHEYGHVIAGHAHRDESALPAADGEVPVYTRHWADEFEADHIGARIVLAEQRAAKAAERDPQFVRRHYLADAAAASGVLYFLLLDMVVQVLATEINVLGLSDAATSHPSSNDRWDQLWPIVRQEYQTSDAEQPPLHLPDAHLQWYDQMLSDLVPAVAARL